MSVDSWILASLCVSFKYSLVGSVRSIDLIMVAICNLFLQEVGQKTWRNSWKSLNKTWILRPDPEESMSLACEGRWLYIVLYFKRNWLNCHSKEDLTHGFIWVFLVKKEEENQIKVCENKCQHWHKSRMRQWSRLQIVILFPARGCFSSFLHGGENKSILVYWAN